MHPFLKNTFFVFILLSSLEAYAQTIIYGVTANKKEIGTLTVTETQENDEPQIEIISDVSVRLIFLVEFNYKLNSVYKDGQLHNSAVTTYLNGKVHSETTIEKKGATYHITKDGDQSTYEKPIPYSGAMIYFYEPTDASIVFSEIHAIENKVERIAPNRYKLYSPKGKETAEYHYKNGMLVKAIVRQPLVDFVMTAR